MLVVICFFWSCKTEKKQDVTNNKMLEQDSLQRAKEYISSIDYDVSQWKELTSEHGVLLDVRYATTNNFTKQQIYDCGRCFLRPELADRILGLQRDIQQRYGLSLKLFDCYRPRPAQQKLWDVVPDETYVTHPSKGSMHNRGLAVDLTLVNKDGEELDMGTEYDFFGRRAHIDFYDLPADVLKNRKLLAKMMEIQGLKGIQSEWWHYSLKTEQAPLDDWVWPCD